ncbi:MAG: hypothetical protein WCJ03_07785 [Bacteroidales bacterium]
MDRVLFGDNQFFAVNHLSDEKSRAQAIRFKENQAIIDVLSSARELGINTFMCTTHDRIGDICDYMRKNPTEWKNFNIFPCMPYAHKYANAVTDLGILGAVKAYMPGNILSVAAKGGMAFIQKDYVAMMELLVDAEMKMFKGINTPVIFLQNVVVDLILGLGMYDFFAAFAKHVKKKYKAEPGFITMNMCKMVDVCEELGIENPVICASINKIGFRVSGSIEAYENYLTDPAKKFRPIAMQVLAAGALKPQEAIEYVNRFPKIESVLFGASSKGHIKQTKELIEKK